MKLIEIILGYVLIKGGLVAMIELMSIIIVIAVYFIIKENDKNKKNMNDYMRNYNKECNNYWRGYYEGMNKRNNKKGF